MTKKETASLRILVPDATTNYIQNPSLRYDTTGWTAFGSAISRTLDYARFGISSLKVITAGSVLNEGTFYRVNTLTGVSEPITVSAYVRGSGRVRIRLITSPAGSQWASKAVFLNNTRWQRIEVTGFSKNSNDVRLYVESAEPTAKAITFYVDGAQMERKAYSTTYCDGSQPGCRWNVIDSNSISTRDANTREGGKWVTLNGPEREYDDLYMTVVGGLGMAPLQNQRQPFAVAPGSFFQNSKIMERIVTLTFHAKHADLLGKENLSLVKLHEMRQFLINTIKPDLTGGDQDFLMEYKDGDLPLYFRARYDGGLEGEWDVRNKFYNSFPLRLLVVSPLLFEDNQEVATIDFQESFVINNVASRVNGRWDHMNYGFNNSIGDLEIGRKFEIVASGPFTYANFSNSAVDPKIPANSVAYWDGIQWQKLSSGTAVGTSIGDVAVAPNGDIYVTGNFTSIGGVAANRIAKWDGTTWSALGTGLNNPGIHIAIAPNGDLYVGGQFTSAGGVTVHGIAKWNGSSWSAIGATGGFNGDVYSIAISPDGTYMYIGGTFTAQFSGAALSCLRIAKYTVSTNTFEQVASGFNANVLEVVISPSGILYVSGDFTASGTTSCNRMAQLLGSAFAPLGSGMDAPVNSFDVGVNGDIIAVGGFTTAGGIPARGIALWNGSSWVNLDILVSIGGPTPTILAAQFTPAGDLYVGGQGMGLSAGTQSQVSGITTITNTGSAETSPFFYVRGAGTLRWLENQTTKKRIFLNMQVLPGEEVLFDFGRGTVESTVRGSLLSFVLRGSDFNAFKLAPGENKIACLITNDVDAMVRMGYTPSHWSMDASV